MSEFTIRDEQYVDRVQQSFARQGFMTLLEAELMVTGPGAVDIAVNYSKQFSQQHGYFHGGLIGTIADNAGGYAAYTLMKAQDSVLTVEYKINIMAPAHGERLIARGRVLRPGNRVSVCQSDVFAVNGDSEKLCATMLGTFMTLAETSDHPG